MIVPVLVVSDEALWVADYSDNGALTTDPRQVQETMYYVGHAVEDAMTPTYTMSHLHIYTRSRVAEVLLQLGERRGIWENAFPER